MATATAAPEDPEPHPGGRLYAYRVRDPVWPSLVVLLACAAAFWFGLTYRRPSTAVELKQAVTGTTQSIQLSPAFDNGVLVLSVLIAIIAVVNLLDIVQTPDRF